MSTGGDPNRPRGIDVSQWQPTTPSLAGKAFLIARASIGTTADAVYNEHIANARKAGVYTGAYHFNWDEDSDPATPDATPEEQARFFLRVAGDVDLYALDVEGKRAFEPDEARRFIQTVQRAGKRIGLYHSISGYFDAGQDWDWVAWWPDREPPNGPARHWDIWQYGSDPTYKPKIIDGNVARDDATLVRITGKVAGDEMRWLAIPQVPSVCEVPKGATLYVFSDLRPDNRNVTLSETHPQLRYIGHDGVVACVGWDRSPDIDGMSGLYVQRDVPTNIRPAPSIVIPTPPKAYPVTVGGKDAGSVILP